MHIPVGIRDIRTCLAYADTYYTHVHTHTYAYLTGIRSVTCALPTLVSCCCKFGLEQHRIANLAFKFNASA